MSRTPTYILAPNFTLTLSPQSPYYPYLGNIIPDPLSPTTRILSKLPTAPSGSVTVKQQDNAYKTTKGLSLNASIWATFLESVSPRLGGSKSNESSITYEMDGLETQYFEPSDKEIEQRAPEPRVLSAINAGLFGKKPVYMITGLKIAKGLRVSTSSSRSTAADINASAPIPTPAGNIGAGAEVGAEKRSGEEASWKMGEGEDVVFAYQVHIIRSKGSGAKATQETEVWRGKGTFLGEDTSSIEEGMEAVSGTKELLEEDMETDDPTVRGSTVRSEDDDDEEEAFVFWNTGQV